MGCSAHQVEILSNGAMVIDSVAGPEWSSLRIVLCRWADDFIVGEVTHDYQLTNERYFTNIFAAVAYYKTRV